MCDMKNANGNMLDAKVIAAVKSLGKKSNEIAKQIMQTKKEISGDLEGYNAEVAKVKQLIADNEADIKALVISLGKADGTHAEKYIVEQIDELHEKSEALKQRLSELESITSQHRLADIEFDIISQTFACMSANIDDYTVEEKRAAIRTFIRKIVWDGENAHLYLFGNDGDYEFPNPPDGGNNPENDKNPNGNSEDSESPLGEDSE